MQRLGVSSALYVSYFLVITLATTLLPATSGLNGIIEHWNIWKLLPGVVVCALFPLLIKDEGKPSHFFIHLIALLIVAPTMVLFASGDVPFKFPVYVVLCCVIVSVVAKTKVGSPFSGVLSQRAFLTIALALTAIYFASLLYFGQIEYFNLDISKVYEIRREAEANLPAVYGYFMPWIAHIAIAGGLAVAVSMRKWWAFGLLSVASVGMLGFTANKEPVIYPMLVASAYVLATRPRALLALAVVCALIVAIDAPFFYERTTSSGDVFFALGRLSDYGFRRGVLVPNVLNWYYIDFFSGRGEFYWWSMSKASLHMLTPPYDVTAPFKIGAEYFGSPSMSANAGWIGTGFSNAGLIGAVLYSAVLGSILVLLDGLSMRLGAALTTAFMVVPVLVLIISADLFTALLTHGLIIALAVAVSLGGIGVRTDG